MTEIAVVLVLALVFLGPKKLPELASGLGKMIREIKKVTAGVKEDIQLDENIRKPFEELREAIQLPAAELKRRDEWKAEWEKRQEDEAAAAALEASSAPVDDPTSVASHHAVEGPVSETADPFAATSSPDHSLIEDAGDKTMISPAPSAGGDPTLATSAPPLANKTIAASVPSAPRLPTAPPLGAVAAAGRTILGVVPGLPVSSPPSRPTPPPPPPAASRLPVPKVPARSVPIPEVPSASDVDDSKPV